jgi:hypothetical protein
MLQLPWSRVVCWLTLQTWTHSASFSATLAEPNFRQPLAWNSGTQPSILESSRVYVTTDGQSASLSWNKAPIWGLRPHSYYCKTVADLLIWDALSDEWMGLSFTIAAGPRQSTHSRVRVPWDSGSYFTASDSRLSFSSPPTIRSGGIRPRHHKGFCRFSTELFFITIARTE